MFKTLFPNFKNEKKGFIMSGILVFSFVAVIIISGLTSWFGVVLKSNRNLVAKEKAFHIAEAGIEYYRWHLAHDKDDFQDGTNELGPYTHDITDKDGEKIGKFSLKIIPPSNDSTLVILESTGFVDDTPEVSRTIRVKLAIPSFAKFALVSDSDIRFGEGTEVYGPIHSNDGIRFDGLAHNIISSAKEYYDDPDHSGVNEFGVHTHLSPLDPYPPSEVPNRPDVFESGRKFPDISVDFNGIINDLANFKTLAQNEGGLYFSSSGRQGYLMVLKTNDTFDLYQVRTLESVPSWSCENTNNQSDWGTWSVNKTRLIGNYSFPSNGVIFFEDDLWVEGQIDTARLSIIAARFPDIPSNRKSITVNNDLKYTNYDGKDVIALIAQQNINVGLYSDDDLQIDAALISQNGRVGRFYYPKSWQLGWYTLPGCSPYSERNTITLNGMIASKLRYGFAYTDDSGYANRNINYDANLLYGPPPFFPLTSDHYEILTWEEIE